MQCGPAATQPGARARRRYRPGKPLDPKEGDSFLAVHADGSVTIYTSKMDVGTGLRLAMSQMVAEELGIPVARIAVVEGDTALTPDHGGTGGSTGIPRGAVEIRQAAATARQAILRPDVPGKCTGQHIYLQDFTVPGMLHGRVIRPSAIGATLLAVDESSLGGIPDVRVVRPGSPGH